ncbi:hypothetical protein LOC72_11225 [Roseiconus lacunae]|nr:hypothetical protein [Roseiconus lacunae]
MSDSYNSYLVDDFSSGSIDPPWVVRNWGGLQSASVVSGAIHLRTTSGDIWSNTFSSCGVVRPAPVGTGWTASVNLLDRNNARYSRTLLLLEKDQPDSRFVGLVENDSSGEWTYLWRDGQNVASEWTGGNPFQLFNPVANPWHSIRYNGSTVDFFVGGNLIGSRAIGWTPGFIALAGKSQTSPTIAATLEYDNYAVVPSGGSLTELHDGPEPRNTVTPTLAIDASSWSGSVGSWDSQSNGAVTYVWELRDADDDSVVESGTGSSPSGTGSYSGDYYLWVRAANLGDYDPDNDSVSSTETASGGVGGGFTPWLAAPTGQLLNCGVI